MNDNITNIIKKFDFFSELDDETFKTIILSFEIIELSPYKMLFNQGDHSDCMYILVSGNLASLLENNKNSGGYKLLNIHGPGEMIGELGALSGAPRSLSIKIINEVTLLKISAESLAKLCTNYPIILNKIMRAIIFRSQHTAKYLNERYNFKISVVIAANEDVPLDIFIKHLKEIVVAEATTKIIVESDDIVSALKLHNIGKQIIVIIKPSQLSLVQAYLANVHQLYLLADTFNQIELFEDINYLFNTDKTASELQKKLILLHQDNVVTPTQTIKWLNKSNFIIHHHVRLNNISDYQRLYRFISGKATTLVLSGGGAKGWAHLGVIKALYEKNILIDAIGGSSIGALLGGCIASLESYAEIKNTFEKITDRCRHMTSWINLSFSLISLISSKKLAHVLQEVFTNIQIEDLWIPTFCMTANLSERKEHRHATGSLSKAILASNALPGIFPPVIYNGQLHVDGGVVNNLPVDVMRTMIGQESQIIASKLSSSSFDTTHYNYPEAHDIRKVTTQDLDWKKISKPSLIYIIYNSLMMGSLQREKSNELMANFLVNPSTEKYKIYNFSLPEQEINKLITSGYQETIRLFL